MGYAADHTQLRIPSPILEETHMEIQTNEGQTIRDTTPREELRARDSQALLDDRDNDLSSRIESLRIEIGHINHIRPGCNTGHDVPLLPSMQPHHLNNDNISELDLDLELHRQML